MITNAVRQAVRPIATGAFSCRVLAQAMSTSTQYFNIPGFAAARVQTADSGASTKQIFNRTLREWKDVPRTSRVNSQFNYGATPIKSEEAVELLAKVMEISKSEAKAHIKH